jgi:hypothetical protein
LCQNKFSFILFIIDFGQFLMVKMLLFGTNGAVSALYLYRNEGKESIRYPGS